MMAQTPPEEASSCNGGMIKVGTTGKIGTLMSQELESIKPHASSSSGKKPQPQPQNPPVSVLCGGGIPKRTQQREAQQWNGSGSNRDSSSDHRYKPRKNVSRAPMLGSQDTAIDRNQSRDKVDKKGRTYTAQVVDIKCSNPVSSRLKKLGFSKLSESFA